jgi:hypothetical protein
MFKPFTPLAELSEPAIKTLQQTTGTGMCVILLDNSGHRLQA